MSIDSIWPVHFGKLHTPTLTCTHEQLSDVANGLRYVHDHQWKLISFRPVCGAPFSLMRFNGVNRVAY